MEHVLVSVIGTLIVLILGYNTRKLSKVDEKVDAVKDHVGEINGSVKEVKTWETMHENMDTERFTQLTKEMSEVKDMVNRLSVRVLGYGSGK